METEIEELKETIAALKSTLEKAEGEIIDLKKENDKLAGENARLEEEIYLSGEVPEFETMMDEMKQECFLECMDKFSLSQLEKVLGREVITVHKVA